MELLYQTVVVNKAPDIDITHRRITEDKFFRSYPVVVFDRVILAFLMEGQFTGRAGTGF